MKNLSQEYLTLISRQARTIAAGTVAKPAQPNTRSDAASANELATDIQSAEDCIDPHAAPAVPAWKLMCVVMEGESSGLIRWCSILSPTRAFWWSGSIGQWLETNRDKGVHGEVYIGVKRASEVLAACTTCPPDWPTPAHADDPREEPEPFCEATGPMPETTTRTDPMPGSPYARKITKPCESIEKLIDRLAKVNGSIDVSHGMSFRVTGDVEKEEPRTYDTPGHPQHFALHHVYLPEDWTRDILAAISFDLTSKVDKGTLRTVLESAARALLLTGSLDEADLLGLAVAVEDKLDIGR